MDGQRTERDPNRCGKGFELRVGFHVGFCDFEDSRAISVLEQLVVVHRSNDGILHEDRSHIGSRPQLDWNHSSREGIGQHPRQERPLLFPGLTSDNVPGLMSLNTK